MAYSLHKSGIITGTMNSFCLACDSFLEYEVDAIEHTAMQEHRKNIRAVPYSDKFEGEHIRKFKWGYYCEFCNLLLPIAAKVNLHINEDEHKQNKKINLLEQVGDDVLAYNNVVIGARAWHGLIDDICSICNTEYEYEMEHKNNAKHCLNLVLKPIQFGEDNAIYRNLDESSVQCLTCNKLVVPSKMTEHFSGSEHNEIYSKRIIIDTPSAENGQIEVEPKIDTEVKPKKKTSAEENSKIMEAVVRYQSQGVNINLETETAFCKKCSNVIPFEFIEIESHIKNHSSAKKLDSELLYPPNVDHNLNRVNINDKTANKTEDPEVDTVNDDNKTDETIHSNDEEKGKTFGCSSQEPEKKNSNLSQPGASDFATENQITYNEGHSEAYCRICSVNLPSPLKSMQEHVAGANHTKLAKTSVPVSVRIPCLSKQESKLFFDSVYQIENFFYHETIINEEFCIPQNSYLLVIKNNSRLRCILCEENISTPRLVAAHVKTQRHRDKMEKTFVIISEESEFIREVRPGLFHCGYCHLVVSGWAEMKKHLKCDEHTDNRALGERRLELHYPAVQRHKMERDMNAMRLMWFLNRL